MAYYRGLKFGNIFTLAQISQKLSTKRIRLNAQNIDLAPFWGDLIQREKLSKIKPPLSKTSSNTSTFIIIENILNLKKVYDGKN